MAVCSGPRTCSSCRPATRAARSRSWRRWRPARRSSSRTRWASTGRSPRPAPASSRRSTRPTLRPRSAGCWTTPDAAERMGRAGKTLAAERYSWERVASDVEALYEEVARTGVGPREVPGAHRGGVGRDGARPDSHRPDLQRGDRPSRLPGEPQVSSGAASSSSTPAATTARSRSPRSRRRRRRSPRVRKSGPAAKLGARPHPDGHRVAAAARRRRALHAGARRGAPDEAVRADRRRHRLLCQAARALHGPLDSPRRLLPDVAPPRLEAGRGAMRGQADGRAHGAVGGRGGVPRL